jgi:predicted nucleic acid-binding protein
MSDSFGDTSYFLALLIPEDVNHSDAHSWSIRLHTIVTSEYVIVEVGNFLSRRVTRRLFGDFYRTLRSSNQITIEPASSGLL